MKHKKMSLMEQKIRQDQFRMQFKKINSLLPMVQVFLMKPFNTAFFAKKMT
jgi:membrane-anchored glycerophosphoryl diester phosphodiesterase (GDPDase)